jgi:hypothetical protein
MAAGLNDVTFAFVPLPDRTEGSTIPEKNSGHVKQKGIIGNVKNLKKRREKEPLPTKSPKVLAPKKPSLLGFGWLPATFRAGSSFSFLFIYFFKKKFLLLLQYYILFWRA